MHKKFDAVTFARAAVRLRREGVFSPQATEMRALWIVLWTLAIDAFRLPRPTRGAPLVPARPNASNATVRDEFTQQLLTNTLVLGFPHV